jgi:hypothetical protein
MTYAPALQVALQKFRFCSLEDIKNYSGYSLQGDRLQINFLGQQLEVEYPSGKFLTPSPSAEKPPLFIQILILHYLSATTETVTSEKLISFKELSGGNIYIEPFNMRAVRPLAKLFGGTPRRLLEVAACLGGEEAAYGDAAVTIPVFPRIPVTLILWAGDEEFAASANILFNASAARILPTEDYAVLAGYLVAELKRLAS